MEGIKPSFLDGFGTPPKHTRFLQGPTSFDRKKTAGTTTRISQLTLTLTLMALICTIYVCRKPSFFDGCFGPRPNDKSRISDGVLEQKQNRTSRCLKPHASVSQSFGTKRTHSRVPGLKAEALFLKLPSFFGVSTDRRLVQICISLLGSFQYIENYDHNTQ